MSIKWSNLQLFLILAIVLGVAVFRGCDYGNKKTVVREVVVVDSSLHKSISRKIDSLEVMIDTTNDIGELKAIIIKKDAYIRRLESNTKEELREEYETKFKFYELKIEELTNALGMAADTRAMASERIVSHSLIEVELDTPRKTSDIKAMSNNDSISYTPYIVDSLVQIEPYDYIDMDSSIDVQSKNESWVRTALRFNWLKKNKKDSLHADTIQ